MESNVLTYKDWYSINEAHSNTIIFCAGLESRKDLDEQKEIIKTATGKLIQEFAYDDQYNLLSAVRRNPDYPVILFSAGCQWASKVASLVNDERLVYIIEPYAVNYYGTASKAVRDAVEVKGVPARNVMASYDKSRGHEVVEGHSDTPSGLGHFDALAAAGKKYIKGYAPGSYGGTIDDDSNPRKYKNF